MITFRVDLSDLPDWFVRAFWAAVAAFGAVEIANAATAFAGSTLRAAIAAAFAAGISTAKSGIVAWLKARKATT